MKAFIGLALLVLSTATSAQLMKKVSVDTLKGFTPASAPTTCTETGGSRGNVYTSRVYTAKQAITLTLKDGTVADYIAEATSTEDWDSNTGSCGEALARLTNTVRYTQLELFSIISGDVSASESNGVRLCSRNEWNILIENGVITQEVRNSNVPVSCP